MEHRRANGKRKGRKEMKMQEANILTTELWVISLLQHELCKKETKTEYKEQETPSSEMISKWTKPKNMKNNRPKSIIYDALI